MTFTDAGELKTALGWKGWLTCSPANWVRDQSVEMGARSDEFKCHSSFLKRKQCLCKDHAAVPVTAASAHQDGAAAAGERSSWIQERRAQIRAKNVDICNHAGTCMRGRDLGAALQMRCSCLMSLTWKEREKDERFGTHAEFPWLWLFSKTHFWQIIKGLLKIFTAHCNSYTYNFYRTTRNKLFFNMNMLFLCSFSLA